MLRHPERAPYVFRVGKGEIACTENRFSYVRFMKRFFGLFLFSCLLHPWLASAQENRPVTLDPSDVEEIRRLVGRVADLEEAFNAQSRRMANLNNEIETLRRELREAQEGNSRKMADVVTREDLTKTYDKIKEVDEKRLADNKRMLEEIEKMVKELTKLPPPSLSTGTGSEKPERPGRQPKDLSQEKTTTTTNNEEVYTHTVAKGENLSLIIAAYNSALKEKNKSPITLDAVRRANPKINLNNIYVGQEILIPVPPDKK